MILPIPSFRDRIPVIVDEVTTLCGPGELIDVIVTERGIAINPRREDLLEAVARQRPADPPDRRDQGRSRGDLRRQAGHARSSATIVAVVKWVDGTVIDTVWQV